MLRKISKSLILALSLSVILINASKVDAQTALPVGISTTIFNATASVTSGTTFAVPSARAYILTYVVDYTGAPGSITLCIQGSNNNVAWFDLACTNSTTDTGGNIGPTAIKFTRVNISAVAAGTPTVVTMVVQGFNNPAVYSGGTLTTPLLLPNGTASAPGLAIGNSGLGLYRDASANALYAVFGDSINSILFYPAGIRLRNDAEFGFAIGSANAALDTRFRRTAANTVTFDNGAGGAATLAVTGTVNVTGNLVSAASVVGSRIYGDISAARAALMSPADGIIRFSNNVESRTLFYQTIDTPSCTANCGTSPTASGVGSSFDIIMGATGTPTTSFTITFATAWAAAPQCSGSMGTTGMVIGKLPLTFVTTTTTLVVTTNGTAPANSDRYHFQCSLGQ